MRDAIQRGDTAEATRLLSALPKEQRKDAAVTSLIQCAYYGKIDLLNALLKDGAPATAADPRGWTALMAAVKGNQAEAVDILMAHGANAEARTKDGGSSAVMLAAELNRTAIAERLRRGGARAATGTPELFAVAVRDGRLDVVRKCLADPAFKVEGKPGSGALVLAIKAKDIATATSLLDRGVDPNAPEEISHVTPLTAAAIVESPEGARLLLARGADLFGALPPQGRDPLSAAMNARSEQTALVLIHHASEVHHPLRSGMLLFAAIGEQLPTLIEPLLDAGAEINFVNDDGNTPLMWAVQRCHAAVDPLLAHHPRLDLRDHAGRSVFELPDGAWLAQKMRQAGTGALVDAVLNAPHRTQAQLTADLLAAVKKGDAAAVKALLDEGADPQTCNKLGWPVSVLAASRGHTDVLRVLYERNSFVLLQFAPDSLWDSFMEAASNGHLETVRFLLSPAVQPPVPVGKLRVALDYTESRGYREMTRLLQGLVDSAPPDAPPFAPVTLRSSP